MRKALRSLNGRRLRFTARVPKRIRKYYRRKWGIGRAILLEDVWLDGTPVADHVWTEVGPWVKEVSPGDLIAIRASVYQYNRADGYSSDFGLKDVWLEEIL